VVRSRYGTVKEVAEKKQNRRHSEESAAADDEGSLFLLHDRERGIPHCVRNEAAAAFFRSL
jgi:hypothetical protein